LWSKSKVTFFFSSESLILNYLKADLQISLLSIILAGIIKLFFSFDIIYKINEVIESVK
jgi:hypothetical protein